MPKNLTDVNQYVTVSVPVGTDPALASSVEPPFQILADRTFYLLNYAKLLRSFQIANWKITDIGSLSPAWSSAVARGGDFDRSVDCFTFLNADGYTIYSIHPLSSVSYPMGGGGYRWYDEATPPNSLGGSWVNSNYHSIASNQSGVRIVVNPGTGLSNLVARSSGLSAWAPITTASSGYFWYDIDHDKAGLFVIVGGSGRINSSPSGLAGTWTQRTSGVTDQFLSVRHSYDSNNFYWQALSATRSARSADGITWAAQLHNLTSPPIIHTLAYSQENTKWITILESGNLAYSTNNGQSWTETSNPFGIGAIGAGLDKTWLESDGQGNWLFSYNNTGSNIDRKWISIDNGVTWHEIYDGLTSGMMITRFGDDLFVSAGSLNIFASLRLAGG